MSWGGKQPIGQKRLTNIAVVRYKKGGHRFEVACYKNKVVNWRSGVEKDLDEVLQTVAVFTNVSKGVLAKDADLQAVFGTTEHERVCLKILAEGETQVSDKEREVELGALFRDVACTLAERCVNPDTRRPYTATLVERALRDAHFSLDPRRSAKQQALQALPLLQQRLRIERARMRLKITVPVASGEELRGTLAGQGAALEAQDLSLAGDQLTVVCLVEPGAFRDIHALVQRSTEGLGRLEVVSLAAMEEGPAQQGPDPAAAGVVPPTPGPAPSTSAPTADSAAQQADRLATSMREQLAVGPAQRQPAQGPSVGPAHPAPGGAAQGVVVVPRGPIAALPDAHASRRERLAELDSLQPGWTVELRQKGSGGVLDAVLFSPEGAEVGTFAAARRQALQAVREH